MADTNSGSSHDSNRSHETNIAVNVDGFGVESTNISVAVKTKTFIYCRNTVEQPYIALGIQYKVSRCSFSPFKRT